MSENNETKLTRVILGTVTTVLGAICLKILGATAYYSTEIIVAGVIILVLVVLVSIRLALFKTGKIKSDKIILALLFATCVGLLLIILPFVFNDSPADQQTKNPLTDNKPHEVQKADEASPLKTEDNNLAGSDFCQSSPPVSDRAKPLEAEKRIVVLPQDRKEKKGFG